MLKHGGDMIDVCVKRIEKFYPDYLKIFAKTRKALMKSICFGLVLIC